MATETSSPSPRIPPSAPHPDVPGQPKRQLGYWNSFGQYHSHTGQQYAVWRRQHDSIRRPRHRDLVFNGAIVTTDNADKTLIVSNLNTTINNSIGNNSHLIKIGPGTLILGGNNTNGALVINLGTVRVDAETRLGRNPASYVLTQLTLNGGTLQTTETFDIDDPNRGVFLGVSGGTFAVNAGTTLTLANVISGGGSLVKTGPGTLRLTATNSGTGAITNLNGNIVVEGELPGSLLAVTAGQLSGNGLVTAPVIVQSAGEIAPGTSLGTLVVSNDLSLTGLATFEINKVDLTHDAIVGISNVQFGGTLAVTNVQGDFAAGDNFKLFDAISYSGAFSAIVPPTPGPLLAWDTSTLAIDGTLRVVPVMPVFGHPVISGGDLILSGSGGAPGSSYVVLSSTNLATPINQWSVLATNVFDGTGAFLFSTPIEPGTEQRYYRIEFSY